MIEVDLHRKTYSGTPVLGAIRFAIEPGETLALVGPSGIGKSTLLRILAGIDPHYEGSVHRPEAVAMVFQEPTLLPWRSVLDNLRIVHPDLTRQAAMESLAEVDLAGKDALFPGQLSLGQQRRLALARAFAGAPELLIMDEPFVSLDSATAKTMHSLTEALIRHHRPATLFVTHDAQEADRLADRILTLVSSADGAVLSAE